MLRLAGQLDWLNQQVWFIADAEAVEARARRGVESWAAPMCRFMVMCDDDDREVPPSRIGDLIWAAPFVSGCSR